MCIYMFDLKKKNITFRSFLFLGSAISPFRKISTRKVRVLFLSIVIIRQIALSTKVKAACTLYVYSDSMVPDCALILFCEFGIHQQVF